jgi:flagellar basal-body rod modification protein FlgD
MTTAVNSSTAATATATAKKTGFAALGAQDFIKLLTAQLTQQDPTAPVDNKEMVAQMAQFSSLSATTESNETLKTIAGKLDAILAAQSLASGTQSPAAAATPTT